MSEVEAAAGRQLPRSPLWILGVWKDLLLFVATPLLIIPGVALAQLYYTIDAVAMYVAAFGATGHHLPGMIRAYGDRALFRRFRVRFIVAPIFLLVVCIAFAHRDFEGLMTIATLWAFWHGLMQVYGFVRIYDAKVKSFASITSRLDWLMCLGWFGGGLLYSPGRMSTMLQSFYKSGVPLLSPSIVTGFRVFWIVGTALVTVAFAVNLVWRWQQGQRPSMVKLLMMGSSFFYWWYAMVMINHALLGIALFEIFHDVQYLGIVWIFNRRQVDAGSPVGAFSRFLFRRSTLMVGVYVAMVLGYGYVAYACSYLEISSAWFNMESAKLSVFGALTTSGLLHFYYDGFIWRVREQSTRKGLGLQGGEGDTDLSKFRLPGWLTHGFKWGLFVVPAGLLWFAQESGVEATLAQYRNIVEIMPHSWHARNRLASELAEQDMSDEAIKEFREAIRLKPDSSNAQFNLGSLLKKLGHLDEAADHMARAAEVEPRSSLIQYNLGLVYLSQRQLDEAVLKFEEALKFYSKLAGPFDESDIQYALGKALELQGKSKEAIPYLRLAVQAKSQEAMRHHNLAVSLTSDGRLEEAIREYLLALQIEPESSEVHHNLALLRLEQERLEDAAQHFQEVIRIKPDHVEGHYHLGVTRDRQGLLDAAIEYYRRALQLKPAHIGAQVNLARVLGMQGKLDQAIVLLRQVLQIDPDLAEAHMNLGQALNEKGQVDEAKKHFLEAVRLDPRFRIATQ